MFVTAATLPGNARIACRLLQPLNMLLMFVTAATLPGNTGIVCRLGQPLNMLLMFVTAVALGSDGSDCNERQP